MSQLCCCRKQVVNVLWPAGKRRHRGQRGQFSRPVSNAGSDDDQSDFSEEEDLFRALSLERMQLSLPRILTPHKRPVNFSTGPGRNALPSDPNKKVASCSPRFVLLCFLYVDFGLHCPGHLESSCAKSVERRGLAGESTRQAGRGRRGRSKREPSAECGGP